MRWILGVCAAALVFGIFATMTIPAQTITPDQATLKLFPPEATGVAVVDVGGLRGSQLFKDFLLNAKYPNDLKAFIDATGFQPDRDVDQVTVARIGKKDIVAIVRPRYDRFKLEQFIQEHQPASETYLGRVIYSPDRRESSGTPMSFSFIDDLIVAGNTVAVKQVIDRLAAPAQSILDNQALMNGIRGIEAGNQVWAVGEFDLESIRDSSRIPAAALEFARNFTGGSYQMRVDSGIHLKAVGNFTTNETARQTADLLRGLLAVARLQTAQQPDTQHLLDGVQIEYSGNSMTVRFEGEGELLKKLQGRRRARVAE